MTWLKLCALESKKASTEGNEWIGTETILVTKRTT